MKHRTSFALSDRALRLLRELARRHDRSQANMIETLIVEQAKREREAQQLDDSKYSRIN